MGDSLIIKIGANAKEFDKELKALKDKTRALEAGLAKVAKISAAAFLGLAAATALATSKFQAFEKTFTNVETLLDKSSFKTKTLAKGINGLRNDVLKLGAASGESFENLNQGLFDLISAGVPAEEATRTLTDAVNLATAGATNTAVSVKALTAALTSYGSEAGTSAEIAEKFFTAQKFGVTTVEQLASGFNKVAGTAKNLGIGFNEVLSASAALTANGAKPQKQAYTELRAVMTGVILAQGKLKDQSSEVQAALSLQNVQTVGLVEALRQTKEAVGGDISAFQKLLGSAEGLSAALSLTGEQGALFTKILKEMGDEQGRAVAFSDALATKQATVDKALARTKQSFNAVTIQIGERFAPTLIEVADKLNEVAKRFNDLSDEQKDAIADFIKAGLVITGIVTGLATLGIGIIKVTRTLRLLKFALQSGRIAAGLFWGSMTLGLGTVLTFLPEIYSGVKALLGLMSKDEPPKSIVAINRELDKLKEKQAELAETANINRLGHKNNSQKRLEELNAEIKKLEELKKKQIEAAPQDASGSLLLRPETDGSDPLAGLDKDLGLETIPLRPEETGDEKAAAAKLALIKKNKADQKKLEEEAVADKVQIAKNERQLIQAENVGLAEEEIDFLKRRHALEQEENVANKIKNDDLRSLELENVRLKNEQLEIEEQEHYLRTQEIKAEQREQDLVLNEELAQLDAERRAALSERELDDLKKDILTKQQAKKEVAKQDAKERIASRNQEKLDTEKHGVAIAKINSVLNSKQVKGVSDTASQLIQLQNSKNKTLKAIGKKAAQAQIIVDTAKGAVSAFTSMASFGPIGAVIGGVLAGAIIAYGAERLSTVQSAQRGGVVPSASGGLRDRVPMLLEPNELVVPKGLASNFVQSVGNPASGDFANDDASAESQESPIIRLEGDLIQNDEFVASLATKLRDLEEFDNVRTA